ncbi:hypothetical protein F5I97DRAFT_19753 [Phlebopus sp. FC_14]|nr:hypothetical protein F5I97DRAFT_19753 [Phlebopus sp. FC_14]
MRTRAFETSPYPDTTPRLSPDSSPACSVASSSVLMTPENGVSLADIENSPQADASFCDLSADDVTYTGYLSPYFAIDDPFICDAAGYPPQEMMPEDIACNLQVPLEPVHGAPTSALPRTPSPFLSITGLSASEPHPTIPLPRSPVAFPSSQLLTVDPSVMPTGRSKSRASSAPPTMPSASEIQYPVEHTPPVLPAPSDSSVQSMSARARSPTPVPRLLASPRMMLSPGISRKLEATSGTTPSILIPSVSPALSSVALSPVDSVNEDFASLLASSQPVTPLPATEPLPSPPQVALGKRRRVSSLDDDAPLPKIARRSKPIEGDDDDDEWVPTPRRPSRVGFASSSAPVAPKAKAPKGAETKGVRRTPKSSRPYKKLSSKAPRVQCQLCRKSFSRAGDVSRHQASACPVLKQQNEILTFTCPICGDELSRKDSRTRHFKGRHPEVDPAVFDL